MSLRGERLATRAYQVLATFCNHGWIKKILPGVVFIAVLLWQWRIYNLFATIPQYGDTLEVMWAIEWYREALSGIQETPFFHPGVFHPPGWQLFTFAHGFGLFVMLLPLALVGGAAFALNILSLTSFLIAYAGMYRLARRFMDTFPAVVAALLFTFWGGRWVRLGGQLNLLLGSSLLPWMIVALERAYKSDGRRRYLWLVLAGVGWACAATLTFYFVWIGGFAILLWTLGSALNGRISWRTTIQAVALPSLTAGLLVAPFAFLFWRALKASHAPPFSVIVLSDLSTSLNVLPLPFVGHWSSWLRTVAHTIYTGPLDETSVVGFGMLAFAIFLVMLFRLRRRRHLWPAALIAVVAMVLALGPILNWNHEYVQWELPRPVNHVLWQLGRTLQPDIFRNRLAPEHFAVGVPLPHYLLTATVPLFSSARVVARFTLLAAVGFYLLVGLGLAQITKSGLRLLIGVLLLLEVLPRPMYGVPFPPAPHPVFQWLQEQELQDNEAILSVHALRPETLVPMTGGEVLWATREHKQAIVAGGGSVWPPHVYTIRHWLNQHPRPFDKPEFASLMRRYDVVYVLLHQKNTFAAALLEQIDDKSAVRLEACFEPHVQQTPWNYPICVLKVGPP